MTDEPKASVTVAWNSNPEPNIAYYTVHYGTSPGKYSNTVKVGIPAGQTKPDTRATLSNLEPYTLYYCTVSATNVYGLTSDKANEIFTFTSGPRVAKNDPRIHGNQVERGLSKEKDGSIKLNIVGADLPGDKPNVVTVQESTDLKNWKTVHQEIFSGSDSATIREFNILLKGANEKSPRKFLRVTEIEQAQPLGSVNLGGVDKSVYQIPIAFDESLRKQVDTEGKPRPIKSDLTLDKEGYKLTMTAADMPGSGLNRVTMQRSTDAVHWSDVKQFEFADKDDAMLKLQVAVDPKSLPKEFYRFKLEQDKSK